MEKNSHKHYCERGQRKENTDRAKNQSDFRIRYCACLEKNKIQFLSYESPFKRLKILVEISIGNRMISSAIWNK